LRVFAGAALGVDPTPFWARVTAWCGEAAALPTPTDISTTINTDKLNSPDALMW